MTRRIEVIVNPASGSNLALALAERHVLPLLQSSCPSDVRIRQTERASDGIRLGSEIACDLLASPSSSVLNLVLIGGDGTTHEVLNGLYLLQSDASRPSSSDKLEIRLAIVPAGTANALYSAMYPSSWTQEVQQRVANAASLSDLSGEVIDVMLQSVRSLVSQRSRPVALPLMLNRLYGEDDQWSISHLVTSHALHASILHDADTPEMRAKHRGIERFKIAAMQNATKWTHGKLFLKGGVQRYCPKTKSFAVAEADGLQLDGPFLYLNAMVTDRLESAFVPAPLSSAFGSLPQNAIDVVLIRPRRDPHISQRAEEEEEQAAAVKFAQERLGEVTAGMYTGGKHVDLLYEEGEEEEEEPVVEYYRCEGYEWVPKEEEEEGKGGGGGGKKARLVCTDGFISVAKRTVVRRWTGKGEGPDEGRMREGVAPPLIWL